jgi:hypothetical protein
MSNILGPSETLSSNQSLLSKHNNYELRMQGDGNLVLYQSGQARWSSGTQSAGARLVMQDDGNMVIYSAGNQAIWESDTHHQASRGVNRWFLSLQDDGNLVLYEYGPVAWDRISGRRG